MTAVTVTPEAWALAPLIEYRAPEQQQRTQVDCPERDDQETPA